MSVEGGSDAWLVPQWPAPPQVAALCSTRAGGVSAAPYDSLNLGDHVGDDPAAVAQNRQRWAAALGVRPVFLRQVHGSVTVMLDRQTPDGTEADACIVTQPGMACTIMVADCLPVLLADLQGRAVAAAHAGWRGLCGTQGQGVLESLWQSFAPRLGGEAGQAAADTIAWLGPCIGPAQFEVGPEVKAAFEVAAPDDARYFTAARPGKWLADLPRLARRRLQSLGITRVYGNDGSAPWCTVGNPSRFFSHRRDGVSGRLAAGIWLR